MATQHPHNELSWKDRSTVVPKIKKGDKVWIGQAQWPCSEGIKEITRVTPTLLMVGDGKQNWDRFYRLTGFQVGRSTRASYISGIATRAEIAAYEAAELRKKELTREKDRQEKVIADLLLELNSLFPENVFVQREFQNETFSLTFQRLNADQIRHIAPSVPKLIGAIE